MFFFGGRERERDGYKERESVWQQRHQLFPNHDVLSCYIAPLKGNKPLKLQKKSLKLATAFFSFVELVFSTQMGLKQATHPSVYQIQPQQPDPAQICSSAAQSRKHPRRPHWSHLCQWPDWSHHGCSVEARMRPPSRSLPPDQGAGWTPEDLNALRI